MNQLYLEDMNADYLRFSPACCSPLLDFWNNLFQKSRKRPQGPFNSFQRPGKVFIGLLDKSRDEAVANLTGAFESAKILKPLENLARKKGMSQIARESGLGRRASTVR